MRRPRSSTRECGIGATCVTRFTTNLLVLINAVLLSARPLEAGLVARVPGAHGFLNASTSSPAEANSKVTAERANSPPRKGLRQSMSLPRKSCSCFETVTPLLFLNNKKNKNHQFATDAGAADVCVYGWIQCYADAVLLPSSTSELAAAVAGVVAAAGANPLSIRATSSVFHSTSPFTCPYGYGGGLGSPLPFNYGPLPGPPVTSAAVPATAAVLLDSLRGVSTPLILGNNSNDLRMTVLAGSRLWQVLEWAAERGLSPPRGVPTVWSGEKTRRGKREEREEKKTPLFVKFSPFFHFHFLIKKKLHPKKTSPSAAQRVQRHGRRVRVGRRDR
jgi:hypothetical protein